MKQFINKIVNSDESTSSKRVVTLIIAFHFILASFAILFVSFYVIFHIPKGMVDEKLLGMLREVLQYDFYIIISGLGFITVEGATTAFVEGVKAKYSQSAPSVTETTTTSTE